MLTREACSEARAVLFSGHDDDIAGLPQALSGMGLAVAVLMW